MGHHTLPQWPAVSSPCEGLSPHPTSETADRSRGCRPHPSALHPLFPLRLCSPSLPPTSFLRGRGAVCCSPVARPPLSLPDAMTPQDSALTSYKLPPGSLSVTCKHCHPRRAHFEGGRLARTQLLRHKKGYTTHPHKAPEAKAMPHLPPNGAKDPPGSHRPGTQ